MRNYMGYAENKNDKILNELIRLNEVINPNFTEKDKERLEEDKNVGYSACCLKNAVVMALKDLDNESYPVKKDEVLSVLKGSKYAEDILGSDLVSLKEIERELEIRRDWLKALDGVRHGADLSCDIGFGFYEEDLKELARLHKAGNYKFKILELLYDCNFHTECEKFNDCDYDEFLNL